MLQEIATSFYYIIDFLVCIRMRQEIKFGTNNDDKILKRKDKHMISTA